MVIPDAAIEAAHKAWRAQAALDGSIFEYNLRAAIEAAAPHMLAEAWQRGNRAAVGARQPLQAHPVTSTPIRGVRIPDPLWHAAQTVATEQGDNLSDIIRTKLREYIEQQGTTT